MFRVFIAFTIVLFSSGAFATSCQFEIGSINTWQNININEQDVTLGSKNIFIDYCAYGINVNLEYNYGDFDSFKDSDFSAVKFALGKKDISIIDDYALTTVVGVVNQGYDILGVNYSIAGHYLDLKVTKPVSKKTAINIDLLLESGDIDASGTTTGYSRNEAKVYFALHQTTHVYWNYGVAFEQLDSVPLDYSASKFLIGLSYRI